MSEKKAVVVFILCKLKKTGVINEAVFTECVEKIGEKEVEYERSVCLCESH